MTDKQRFQKAIEKAAENGMEMGAFVSIQAAIDYWWETGFWKIIIFSHDFAKAFWGNSEIYQVLHKTGISKIDKEWKRHLQQMVLEKEPLKYLERFL